MGILLVDDNLSDARRRTAAVAPAHVHPLLPRGQDPHVTRHDGLYYLVQSVDDRAITVAAAPSLAGLAAARCVVVWAAPPCGPGSHGAWAPELALLDGRWYIYYAADDGDNASHRMYALESASASPLGPYREWPLLGVNLLSGSMVALLAGLVTLSYMHARRRAETRKERVLSRIYTFVYAVMFGYGLWEIAETLSHLFRGTATGLQPYRAPLFVVTVTLAIGGQWYSTMLPKLRNWASDHLGAGHIYARMLDLNALLTDRVVKMYADRETFARTLRSLGWDGRKGYWGAIAHEAARWMSLSPTGHVAAPSHRSGLAPEVAGTADNISHPSLAIAEARYYTNTYQSVALAAPQMRPDGLPPAPSPTNQHIALVHGTRAANVGRTSASRAKAQALTVGRHVPAMRRVIDLKEMEATLLAANVWLTDQQVHLHADPAAIHAVACCLDKRGVRGYRRRVALEAARWVVLTRAGLAATLAEEAGVAPETVGLASGGYMPLPLTIGRLERELSRLYRDVYRVGVLVDGDENLPGSDLALREWRRWHQEIAALIRGVLPPFDVEERILAAKANERGA